MSAEDALLFSGLCGGRGAVARWNSRVRQAGSKTRTVRDAGASEARWHLRVQTVYKSLLGISGRIMIDRVEKSLEMCGRCKDRRLGKQVAGRDVEFPFRSSGVDDVERI